MEHYSVIDLTLLFMNNLNQTFIQQTTAKHLVLITSWYLIIRQNE